MKHKELESAETSLVLAVESADKLIDAITVERSEYGSSLNPDNRDHYGTINVNATRLRDRLNILIAVTDIHKL